MPRISTRHATSSPLMDGLGADGERKLRVTARDIHQTAPNSQEHAIDVRQSRRVRTNVTLYEAGAAPALEWESMLKDR